MLLTSSQVSAALTGGILILCTFALFVSGLVLQRQSVKNLNAVLHPGGGRKGPWEKLVHKAELALEVNEPAIYGADALQDGPEDTDQAADEEPSIPTEPDWSRRAYVQMVSSTDEICNSIVSVRSLSVQGSKPRRVLIYPSAWDLAETAAVRDGLDFIEKAKKEHLLETLTTGQIAYYGEFLTDRLLNQDFDKIMFLEPAGLIPNATRLDRVFDLKMNRETLSLGPTSDTSATLLQPRLSRHQKYEDYYGSSQQEVAEGSVESIESIRKLRSMKNAYSQGQLLGDIGYIHLRDPHNVGLTGPAEGELKKKDEEIEHTTSQRSLESSIKEMFQLQRASVCGSSALR